MAQDKLMTAAIREFGTHGLEGVSTRQVARAAGTAMSAITYHYGGKEQLYHAAAERVAEDLLADFGAVLDQEEAESAGPKRARAAVHRLLGALLTRMAGSERPDHAKFVAREQMSPTDAFAPLWSGLIGRTMTTLVRLVGVATGVDEDEATVATLALIGQATVLRSSRATVLQLTGRAALDPDWVASFRSRLVHYTDAILDAIAHEDSAR